MMLAFVGFFVVGFFYTYVTTSHVLLIKKV